MFHKIWDNNEQLKNAATRRRIGETIRYYYLKLMRTRGSPEYIARGVALGLFIGFFIPLFCQLVIVIPLAFVLRAAKVPAIAFTFVSNHFSVFLIYPLQCWLGSYLIFRPFRYAELHARLQALLTTPSFEAFRSLGTDVALSFFTGGLLLGLLSAIPAYFITIELVKKYRKRRDGRRSHRNNA